MVPHEYRASKSPDFAGDLPIFDKIMKISRSPDLESKSPDLLQDTMSCYIYQVYFSFFPGPASYQQQSDLKCIR